jgi:hypothetical protein
LAEAAAFGFLRADIELSSLRTPIKLYLGLTQSGLIFRKRDSLSRRRWAEAAVQGLAAQGLIVINAMQTRIARGCAMECGS